MAAKARASQVGSGTADRVSDAELVAVPVAKVGTVDVAIRVEISEAPGRDVRELVHVPDTEVSAVHDAVQRRITQQERPARRQVHGASQNFPPPPPPTPGMGPGAVAVIDGDGLPPYGGPSLGTLHGGDRQTKSHPPADQQAGTPNTSNMEKNVQSARRGSVTAKMPAKGVR